MGPRGGVRVGESFSKPCAHFSKMATGERTLSLKTWGLRA